MRIFKLRIQAFDVRELHRSPPFFSDQGGTFEVVEDGTFSAGLRPIHVEIVEDLVMVKYSYLYIHCIYPYILTNVIIMQIC